MIKVSEAVNAFREHKNNRRKENKLISNLRQRVQTFPISTAVCERGFSTINRINRINGINCRTRCTCPAQSIIQCTKTARCSLQWTCCTPEVRRTAQRVCVHGKCFLMSTFVVDNSSFQCYLFQWKLLFQKC